MQTGSGPQTPFNQSWVDPTTSPRALSGQVNAQSAVSMQNIRLKWCCMNNLMPILFTWFCLLQTNTLKLHLIEEQFSGPTITAYRYVPFFFKTRSRNGFDSGLYWEVTEPLRCGDRITVCSGPLLPHTGFLKVFSMLQVQISYFFLSFLLRNCCQGLFWRMHKKKSKILPIVLYCKMKKSLRIYFNWVS